MNSSASHPADLVRLPLAVIRVGGADRVEFLQGQLTQDVTASEPSQPLLAGWTSPKGRLLCLVWLLNWNDALWLLLPADLRDTVVRRLRMFVLRADVTVETPDLAVAGGRRDGANYAHNHSDKNSTSYCFYNDKGFSFSPFSGYVLSIGVAAAADSAGTAEHDWQLAGIRAGMPSVHPATAESFVPQMVNLDLLGGISFVKGCYVGQEIVARTQNLGRIKRRMYRFKTSTRTEPGASVYADGRAVGEIVAAVVTPNGTELLAVVRIESLAAALSLDADGKSSLVRAALPYSVPESVD